MRKLPIQIGLLATGLVAVTALWLFSRRPPPINPPEPAPSASSRPAQSSPSSPGNTREPLDQAKPPSDRPNAQARFRALLLAIQGETDPIRRSALIRQFIAAAGDTDMTALLGQIRAGEGLEDVETEVVLAWAKTQPALAAQWVLALPPGDSRDQHLNSVATAWADSDLASAIAWLKTLPPDLHTDTALAVAHEAARVDPISALKLLTELPASDARNDLAVRALREWAAQDPGAASQWTLGISDPTLRETAIAEAAAVWGSLDPEAAAIFATRQLPPGDALSQVVIDIVQSWAAQAPDKAAAWAALFPDGTVRATAFHAIIPTWYEADPAAVAQWLANQPAGAPKDLGTAEYAAALAQEDPASGLAALNTIANQPLRQQQAERIAAGWMAHEPEAARRWVESSDLPAETKERLLAPETPPATDDL